VRLGGPPRKPAPAPAPSQATRSPGQRLYEALAAELAQVEPMQQLELGGALVEGRLWADVPPEIARTFESAARRLGRG